MKKITFTLLISCFAILNAHAQPGAIDLSFNPTDKGNGFGDGANKKINSIALQSDGKILIGGEFTSYNTIPRNYIARLNSNGGLDTSFNPGTGANNRISKVVVQTDGRIIIGGSFTSFNGTAINRIARLNSDGSLDNNFSIGSGSNGDVNSIAVQNDGKIIIGGNFSTYNGTSRTRLARLNNDGSLDTTFDTGTGLDSYIYAVAIQNDGRIVIGGDFTAYNGKRALRIARLNSDGSLDSTVKVGTGPDQVVRTFAIQNNGKIVIGGNFKSYNGTTMNRIARLNSDGSLDTSFNSGIAADSNIMSVVLQSDGKIIIGGPFTSYNGSIRNYIARLKSDGSLDSSLPMQKNATNIVQSIAVQTDGKILVGGDFISFTRQLARFNSDGSPDITFYEGTGANGTVSTIAIQHDGKAIIGGYFTFVNASSRNYIARLNIDGSLDNSFNPGTGANDHIQSLAIQSDGKIIVAGYFTSFNGQPSNRIVRLNKDGSLDSSFNSGTAADSTVKSVAIQNDGKIIIVGNFSSYNGTARNRIACLNRDGSLDNNFNPGTGLNKMVQNVLIQKNGKILITGWFTSYNNIPRNYLASINSDGSLDTTFNQGTGASSYVDYALIKNDGKIIISGIFSSYNGISRKYLTCLNADGTLDPSFTLASDINSEIAALAVQGDGKFLIGGNFNSYNGVTVNRIARLNPDGSLDLSFNPGTGPDYYIYTAAIQNDGRIIIGGNFFSYDGTGRNRITRLKGGDDLNTITGLCYIDYNQNNFRDSGEPGFRNAIVSSTSSGYIYSSATNPQGAFLNFSDSGSIVTSPRNHPYYTISPTPHVSYFSNYRNNDTINFAFVPISNFQDLRITLIPLNFARVGRDVNYRIVYENVGTKTMSGSVFMNMNSGLTFVSANPGYNSINGTRLEWVYSNFVPNESRSIDVTLKVSAGSTIGDLLLPDAFIEPITSDTTPSDNSSTIKQFVGGSYDPNDKSMLLGDNFTTKQISDGEYLNYLIRFQNTGNDTAFTVVVRDTLDSKLDWNSFEMISSSHDCATTIRDGKNIVWTFDNILLPDSNVDEPGSHGYICYRIKPNNNLQAGDEIKNTAYIYFDYNTPVITNTAVTTVITPTNIKSPSVENNFTVYPNPALEKITIQRVASAPTQLQILNVLGETVLQVELDRAKEEIDISSLTSGIYFIRSDNYSTKFVVQ